VTVVDAVFVLATQPFHPLHQLLCVPHLDLRHADPHLDFFATQPRRHRVGILLDLDRTHATDPHARAFQRLQACRRQRPQAGQLDGHFGDSTGVARRHLRAQPVLVRHAADKVPAATQQQCLLDRLLEVPVRRLHVAVFIAAVWVGRLRDQPVVRHERLVIRGELLRPAVVMDGQGHPVRAMTLGHRPQRPQGILQTRA
jgi:hypothetical protein